MIRLESVTAKNVWEIVGLRVQDAQRGFVAGNDVSLIEAYTTLIANGHVFPFGVYADDTPVGFLMIGFDVDDHWEDYPPVAKGNYNIWRLMIDYKYQNKGYGRAAVRLALDFVRSFPCGHADCCWLSYAPQNEIARRLYRGAGFEETGGMDGQECIAVLQL